MITSLVVAQDCKSFIYMTNGKVVKYNATNAKGKLTTSMTYRVKAKTGNKATVASQVFDEKGKEISAAEVEMLCEGNDLKIDMRNFMPNSSSQFKGMTMKAETSYLNYPTKMQVGQQLTDGNFSMQMYNETQKMADVAFKIVNRKVEGTESVTTASGTYDCYKINYTAEIKTTTFGIGIPVTMQISEWYAPKLGLYVKSEAYTKAGKLMSTTVLESIN